jgi:hypothetical protein
VDEIVDELFRDPFEGVPSEVWEEFTRAAAMFGDGVDEIAEAEAFTPKSEET